MDLSVNDKLVDSVAFDGAKVSASGFAVSVWRGVPLLGERTNLSAVVRGPNGTITARLSRDVFFVQEPARVEVVAKESRLVADGKTRPVLAVRVTDRNGRPVHDGITGELTLTQPYESAQSIDLMQVRTLSGLNRAAPSYVVRGDRGVAYIELAPTLVSGPLRAEFIFKDSTITRRQTLDAWVAPGTQKWTLVGLAEIASDNNSIARQMRRDGRFDSDLGDNGRLAFYAKGRVLGKYLLTASYDSAKQKDQQRLLGSIDPNAYYTVFGDGSSRRFDAASREKLYVRIEARSFYALYGDFVSAFDQTILARYQRTFNGAAIEGSFGALGVQGFAAQTETTHRREEIQGAGISGPYRLSGRQIVANSEIVTIQVRDRFRSEIIVDTKTLQRFIDYDLDLLSRTISFRKPILSRDANLNPQFIVVNYDVEGLNEGSLNAGVRATLTSGDSRFRIGATAITDTGAQDSMRTRLLAVDAKATLGARTELRAEAALSQANARIENAWIAEVEHHSASIDALAYVRSAEANFGVGQLNQAERGRRKIGIDGRYRINDNLSVTTRAWYDDSLTDAARRLAAEVNGVWQSRDSEGRLGLAIFDDVLTDGTAVRSTALEAGTTRRMLDNKLELSGSASIAIGAARSIDLPSRYRIGAAYSVSPSAKLIGTYEHADGTEISANTLRAGVEVGPWDGARLVGTLGQQAITEYGSRSFAAYGLTQTLQLTPTVTIDATAEQSTTVAGIKASDLVNIKHPAASGGTLSETGSVSEDFTALTFGLSWRKDRWSVTGRWELRDGELSDRRGLTFGAIRQLGEGSIVGLGLSATRMRDDIGQQSRTYDAAISFAHRPADGALAVLSKMELRNDETSGPGEVIGRVGGAFLTGKSVRSRRAIASTSLNWSPRQGNARRTEVALFAAVRHSFDMYESIEVSGTSLIGGIDGRLGIGKSIEMGPVATVRHSLASGTTSFAAGPQVGFSLLQDTLLTVGYNVVGYSDPDFRESRETSEGAFVAMRLKFDAGMIARLGLRP